MLTHSAPSLSSIAMEVPEYNPLSQSNENYSNTTSKKNNKKQKVLKTKGEHGQNLLATKEEDPCRLSSKYSGVNDDHEDDETISDINNFLSRS